MNRGENAKPVNCGGEISEGEELIVRLLVIPLLSNANAFRLTVFPAES